MTVPKATWNVGIIGCGHAGSHHASAFAAQQGFVLAGCASRRAETAEMFGARFGGRAYESPAALLADDAIDVIVIATPESVRLELLGEALTRRRHLFVEKPVYAVKGQENVTEADYLDVKAVLSNWDRDQVSFGVNFNYRTMPHLRRMKADVETGRLGDIKAGLVWAHFACWSHVIDQLRWILGEIESVSALRSPLSLERVATLRFASGCVGTLCGTSGKFERPALLRIELHGTEARASVEGVHGSYRRDYESDNDSVAWTNPDVSGAV